MGQLFRGVVSFAKTKRRRVWWVAWWTREPSLDPFVPPDASEGGCRTQEEAQRAAERAAAQPLVEIDGSWARAWVRVREGLPHAAPKSRSGATSQEKTSLPRAPAPVSAYRVLGVDKDATDEELKRAFRARALETHPDRGGDVEAFRRMKQAYDTLSTRRARPRAKR